MRTKTLLMAGAALAVSLATSQAQVYSANIVGYANVVIKGGVGQYTLLANPFDDGNGNQLTNLVSVLPAGSQVLVWGGTTYIPFNNTLGVWQGNTNLPPGVGFFVRNGNGVANRPTITNTFVGTVTVNVGNSVTNTIPLAYTLWGSPIPYGGDICDSGTSTGDTNIAIGAILPKGSQVLGWDPNGQTYVPATKTLGTWNSTVTLGVGNGFFVRNVNGPATNWVQTLNP